MKVYMRPPLLDLALLLGLVSVAPFTYIGVDGSEYPHLQGWLSSSNSTRDSTGDAPRVQVRAPDCTADELLPSLEEEFQYRWAPLAEGEIRPLEYDCTCRFTKASYFCQHGRADYPTWVPRAVADGQCSAVGHDILGQDPFPPGRSYLFYGNSHMRQVVEAMMCAHQHLVVRREACLFQGEDRTNTTVEALAVDRQCRGCMPRWSGVLSKNGCVAEDEAEHALRCCDDRAMYGLENNSTVHYFFAHHEGNKSLEDALNHFGTPISDYGAVFANVGNEPIMHSSRAVSTAERLGEAGVPLVWLSTYDGNGDIRDWNRKQRHVFDGAGARFIPVHDMMSPVTNFTRGVAEDRDDDHFCLPGPPNELALLVLRLIWALHIEGRGV